MNLLDIECKRENNEDGGIYYAVSFIVDGQPFLDAIRAFESRFAGDLAGSYSHIFHGYYTEEFLLGSEPEYGRNEDKTELLGCTCGCRGCWPLAIKIREEKDKVYWEEFEQPHRDWDYSGFGPFIFDKRAYLDTIRMIPKVEQSGPENPIPSGTSDAGASPASGAPDSRGL